MEKEINKLVEGFFYINQFQACNEKEFHYKLIVIFMYGKM